METNKTVNVAVVGLGFMGMTHLRAYLKNPAARIAAVCGGSRLPHNGVLKGVTGNVDSTDDLDLGTDVRVFRNLDALLADADIDLVDICTPTHLHAPQAIAALRAGKHVLCEKPVARHATIAKEVAEVAAGSPGFLMPAMCMRFWPGWATLKQTVQDPVYGKVLAARFRRVSAMPAWSSSYTGQDTGGALFDMHIHDTDLVNQLFGRPANVFCSGVIAPEGVINHVVAQYDYPEGPVVSAEGSWLLQEGFNMAYTLHFERATLDFDLARGSDAIQLVEQGQSMRVVAKEDSDGYAGEIAYFLQCILSGKPPEVVTPLDAVTALEICEAEEHSVRQRRVVSLE
jgi:predicted dehydrogenase